MEIKSTHKDYSISFARFFAMVFIVACHMMQRDSLVSYVNGNKIEWAFWFNVGVQMFLFISGYLYGNKQKVNTVNHYKKAFSKILIDYYLFICIVCLINLLIPRLRISNGTYLDFLTLTSKVPGLGHLWFVPTILFCYLMIPVFLPVIEKISNYSDIKFTTYSFLLIFLVHVVTINFFKSFSAANIVCFLLGILYSFIERRENKSLKIITNSIIAILAVIIIYLRVKNEYLSQTILSDFIKNNYEIIKQYGHVFLGISLVLVLRFIYYVINKKITIEKHRILDWSDTYSYDIYLTHHIFVQSAFGCVEYIENRLIALPLAVMLTCFLDQYKTLWGDVVKEQE